MILSEEAEGLSGKAVIVTGGTTGIGRATAKRLAAAGAGILIFGRHERELNDALDDIESSGGSGSVRGLTADAGKPEDVERVFAEADAQIGGVDILVNNAALAAKSVTETDFAEWQEVVRTNLLGYMLCARHAVDRMRRKGEGHIVNVGSLSAKVREKGSDVYVATKAGIEGFTDALAKQVAEHGIRVSLIEPGLVATDMTHDKVPPEEQPEQQEEGKILRAEDLAECIHYVVTQPKRVDIALVQIRPLGQPL